MKGYLEIALGFIKRHIVLISILTGVFILLKLNSIIIDTLLLVIAAETIAIIFSGIAQFAFTKLDFTEEGNTGALGHIFLGVHLLVGLAIIGIYIAQFGADPQLVPQVLPHSSTFSSTISLP